MAEESPMVPREAAVKRTVDSLGWGLLLVWIGAALLLELGWGAGLIGAGVIVLAARATGRLLGLHGDRFGVVVGVLLVLCGVWNLFDVSIRLVPLLCIGAGIALLLSPWAAKRSRQAPGGQAGPHAATPPRA